ncbi:acyl carrier protein [Bacillus mycoides]|uniref:Carrier domain-containing protein n=1 Tax=Bacillus thuringiensis serovar navarrensis TaxID=339658 RepID=A0A243ALI1_BACTU|nr:MULTISPECIES: acyl carrier protein [Bacillus]MBK5452288.1 acyl carrier protein [Bacillus sp. TH22]MBK5457797.1 acyl carrier protein [Bacillus sp. TH23]MED1270502.1 acyl carrier protein [Bacillus mycoides]MED1287381.1 acyl carrier protein [Bacillus mycoides]NUC20207.1 acyl carrier protein [Bacillus mycoides]
MSREEILTKLKLVLSDNNISTQELKMEDRIGYGKLKIDSIKFMKLMVDLENEFNIELDYRETFDEHSNTIEHLVQYIEHGNRS